MNPKSESKVESDRNTIEDQKRLKKLLSDCRFSQRFHLSRKINQLFRAKSDNTNYTPRLERLEAELQTSIDKRQLRLQNLPKPEYPEKLPVAERREEIINYSRESGDYNLW